MHCRKVFTAVCILLTSILAGCSNERPVLTPAPANTVRIVSSLPTRGPAAGQARQISDAITLAIKERNGVAGAWSVDYVPLDDGSDETGQWTREGELENAGLAAGDPSVVAYIGPYNSGAAALSLPITNRARLLQASPSVTWPGLTSSGWDAGEPERYFQTGKRNFVRLMPPDSVQAEAAARWASELGYRSIAIVEDGSSYSDGMAQAFAAQVVSLGITATTTLTIIASTEAAPDDRLSGANAIFYAPSSVGNAVRAARWLDPSGLPVFASDTALDPQFINQVGQTGIHWFVLSNSAPADTSGKFTATLTTTGYQDTFPSQFAANAYGITSLILDGIASGAGRDRAALVAFVRGARGAGGQLFDEAGDPNYWVVSGYRWGANGFTFDRTFGSSP